MREGANGGGGEAKSIEQTFSCLSVHTRACLAFGCFFHVSLVSLDRSSDNRDLIIPPVNTISLLCPFCSLSLQSLVLLAGDSCLFSCSEMPDERGVGSALVAMGV